MVQLENTSKLYGTRRGQVKALDEISLQVKEGEFIVVRGPSGSGKTTLLLAIGGMLHPTSGRVIIGGKDIYAMSKRERARFRAENIGFVFQMFHLVPYLSVIENTLLASGNRADRSEAEKLLERLGMSGREHHKPSELSAGERQRTAIARALLNHPGIILADEPTGNLDPENAAEVIEYLAEFHRGGGTVIVVTHGAVADQYSERIIYLREGRIEEQEAGENMHFRKYIFILLCWCVAGQLCMAEPLLVPSPETYTSEYAEKFTRTANTVLAPVYAPLAEQIASEHQLADKEGIGIDLGSGPGNLIIELCKRTQKMHWVNADINPFFFPIFFKAAEKAEVGHRVSAIFADAQAMPFRDNYADIVVSRGSFHFWEDKRKAFSEIYRVLKPGGVAFIGRGFSENLPVEVARKVREGQGKGGGKPKYDVQKTADELREIMKALKIKEFSIRIPKPLGTGDVNYGIWIEFHKQD